MKGWWEELKIGCEGCGIVWKGGWWRVESGLKGWWGIESGWKVGWWGVESGWKGGWWGVESAPDVTSSSSSTSPVI